jgi:TPP-dependent pyruvate/acetoin dehydrogenase alpha subunit
LTSIIKFNFVLKSLLFELELSDQKLDSECQKEVMECFHEAEKKKRAKPTDMFEEVYDKLPEHLKKQRDQMIQHVKLYKNEYPLELYEKI